MHPTFTTSIITHATPKTTPPHPILHILLFLLLRFVLLLQTSCFYSASDSYHSYASHSLTYAPSRFSSRSYSAWYYSFTISAVTNVKASIATPSAPPPPVSLSSIPSSPPSPPPLLTPIYDYCSFSYSSHEFLFCCSSFLAFS